MRDREAKRVRGIESGREREMEEENRERRTKREERDRERERRTEKGEGRREAYLYFSVSLRAETPSCSLQILPTSTRLRDTLLFL